jgi:hypothetical protein
MNIIGVFEFHKFVAAINTSWTGHTADIVFPASSIWAHSSLQMVNDIDTEHGSAETFLSRFTAGGSMQNVHFIGLIADDCTSVRFGLTVNECAARALCTIHFLA